MQIIHRIDDFLYTLFSELEKGDTNALLLKLTDYYTYGPFKPQVTINDGWVTIDIDTPTILSQENDYQKVVSLCEKGKYSEAKPILNKLIVQNPTNSVFHRIKGQVLSDEGNNEAAIDCLIDALRWDSKNSQALVMLGNIFFRHKNDLPTSFKYFDQAISANPSDYVAANNIGAHLMQQGKLDEAHKYFLQAYNINPEYSNTLYALAFHAEAKNDLPSAFNFVVDAIKNNKIKDTLYNNSVSLVFSIANRIIKTPEGMIAVKNYLHKLEFEGDKEIDLIEDSKITTAAKFELAENYSRPKHTVRYKPAYPANEHLVMHELVHLDFILQARKENINQMFVSSPDQKRKFIATLEPSVKKLQKLGLSESAISQFCNSLFDGINLQALNAPIDLFIEDFINSGYAVLRPYQFLSLYNMITEGIKAVTEKRIIELSPREILSKSKIYNLVNALQFRALFGIDIINDFHATSAELKMAQDFFDEYLLYKDDRSPAEEYELVQHWAEDLKLNKYFELIDENEYRTKRLNIDNLLESIERDPFDLETKDTKKEREMGKFHQSQKDIGTNMAVVMFMVDALRYFKDMPTAEVKKIAFEIAMQGVQGYNPDIKGYKLNSVPGKEFSGYHIMAWYYVSWMLAMPDDISILNLPFDKEFDIAKSMDQSGRKL
jgi:tetratricopeptide (TPR) repeat protein